MISQMKGNFFRIVKTATVIAACIGLLLLAGCAKQDIRSQVNTLCDGLAEQNTATAQSVSQTVWFFPEDYGVSQEAFAQAYFADFNYKIKSIKPTKNSQNKGYIVTLKISYVNGETVIDTLEAAQSAAIASGANTSADGYADSSFLALLEAEPWETSESEVSITFIQNKDGDYEYSDGGEFFAASLLGGIDNKQDML